MKRSRLFSGKHFRPRGPPPAGGSHHVEIIHGWHAKNRRRCSHQCPKRSCLLVIVSCLKNKKRSVFSPWSWQKSTYCRYSVFRMDSTYVNIHMYMIVTMNELRISCEFNLYRYLSALNMYKNLYNKDSVQLLCRFIAEIRKKKRSVIHYPQNPGCNHRRSAGILSAIHSNHISTSTASPNKNSGILHFEKKIWVNFK